MRKRELIQDGWYFTKEAVDPAGPDLSLMETISLPHTWNAADGCDGNGSYYRGKCTYARLLRVDAAPGEEVWLEFGAVAMRVEVFVNGKLLGTHLGGYSAFRVNITEALTPGAEALLVVTADNTPGRDVYPQRADFTFAGGIYRDVALLRVPSAHFALDRFGGNGLFAEARTDGLVKVRAELGRGAKGKILLTLTDASGAVAAQKTVRACGTRAKAQLTVHNPRLWNGTKDPYRYSLRAELLSGDGTVLDAVETKTGFRSFRVDPDRGFLLNGSEYPLAGVAMHQDRAGVGIAVSAGMHEQDIALIREMGANTVRLAHYQHDSYVYELADRAGLILWTEIPYISEHMYEAKANAEQQLRELVAQTCTHPSVCFIGLSNEITVVGGESRDMIKAHRRLNQLCKKLAPAQQTVMANLFMLDPDSDLTKITDLSAFNLYYGWYVGEVGENETWFDSFREKFPNRPIGLSEYGADANPAYQSEAPVKGDYSETYQAFYHEHLLRMRLARPYIFASYAWNMFDFAADARHEGGVPGLNPKGLVTYDRAVKKDAFYVYKAYLSDEPFVHIAGKRYAERPAGETVITVYTNQDAPELWLDGVRIAGEQDGRAYRAKVTLTGRHRVTAVCGECRDEAIFSAVPAPNPAYRCPNLSAAENWIESLRPKAREGYYSIYDKVCDIKKNPEAAAVLDDCMKRMLESFGDVARNVKIPKVLQKKLDRMTFEENLKMAGHLVKPDMVLEVNEALSQVRKD